MIHRAEVLTASQAHPQAYFSRANMRTLRMRFVDDPLPLHDGGALQIVTTQDGTAPRGTPNSRIVSILRVRPTGYVEPVAVDWLTDVTHARKAIHSLKREIES